MSSSNTNLNKKLPQKLDKFLKGNTNKNMYSDNINLDQLSKSKPRPDSFNLKDKEEGFSIYLMGANEERMKNIRKKELNDKNSKQKINNSRSIVNRGKWDIRENKINSNSNNHQIPYDLLIVNESRSKSRKKSENKRPIASHIDYKAISKLILNSTNNLTGKNNNDFKNSSYVNSNMINGLNNLSTTKNINSKNSITNIEDILNDIQTVNRNISNLNKINLNSESPINKRRRNWGEPKFNIVFPNLSTSVEKGLGGPLSSKHKKRNMTNYSNNIISKNDINSSFHRGDNKIETYNSVIGEEYHGLNSSIAIITKEKDSYLDKKKLSVDKYEKIINNDSNSLLNITYEKLTRNSNSKKKLNGVTDKNLIRKETNYTNYQENEFEFDGKCEIENLKNSQKSNMYQKLNCYPNGNQINFKNSDSSLILSNLNINRNSKETNINSNLHSTYSNKILNSNPDVNLTDTKSNSKSKNRKEILKSAGSSGLTNRFRDHEKNKYLNNSNEIKKTDEVMLVLENLNNSDVLNISNPARSNLNVNYLKKINLEENEKNQIKSVNLNNNFNFINNYSKNNSESMSNNQNKNSKLNFSKKYNNISVNVNYNNSSNLNTRKFISLNSNLEKKIDDLNNSSNKNKILLNLANNPNSKYNNNPNSGNNTNANNLSQNSNERPFSSIVNLSKLKSEKLKITDLGSVSGISPKNNIPSIQFIYKSPQNINLKSAQRPLSHIQKSKSILNTKSTGTYVNLNSNNNGNLNNAFENTQNAFNFKNTNTYSTMERFSSRENQTNFIMPNGSNFLEDNGNLILTKEISNTQFNFSRKKAEYPSISNVQKLSNVSSNLISNNNILSNLVYTRNNSNNHKNYSSGNYYDSNNILLSNSNVKDVSLNYNNINTKNSNLTNKKGVENMSINNVNSMSNKDVSKEKEEKGNNLINNKYLKSNSRTVNKLKLNDKKHDILSQLDKLDEKKMKKVFKYIEKLSEHNYDTSDISMMDSKNFNENAKNMVFFIFRKLFKNFKYFYNVGLNSSDKLNINYIKTDSINFGNININLNNNLNTTSSAVNHISSLGKQNGTPNLKRELNQASSQIKNKLINMNNSITSNQPNNITVTQYQKPSFSASMKEKNKNFKTLEDDTGFVCNDRDEYSSNFIENQNTKKSSIKNFSAISLLIKSNWGNMTKCGVTEVQLLDEKNRKIDIKECHVFNGTEDNINKIFNNKYNTTDDNDMWTTNHTKNLRIEIYFEPNATVDKILIWNFNGKDLSKGIREIEVVRRNKVVWKGIIQKGSNNLKSDYLTKIKLEKEGSISNFDFINLIYKESFENFDFLSSTVNSPSKTLLKSNTTNNNHSSTMNINTKNSQNLSNNKLNFKNETIKNIFVENNLSYSNSYNKGNEIIISDEMLRNSIGSIGKGNKINFESITVSSARNNVFNKSSNNQNKSNILNLNSSSNNLKSQIGKNYSSNLSNIYSEYNSSHTNQEKSTNVKENQDLSNNLSNSSNFVKNGSNHNLANNQIINNETNNTNSQNFINSASAIKNQTNENNPLVNSDENIEQILVSSSSVNAPVGQNLIGNNITRNQSAKYKNSSSLKNQIFNSSNNNTKMNIYNLSSNNNESFSEKRMYSVSCSRMKIILRSGYGDPEYIGLTGIQFFDENNEPINIEKAKTIGALPKDINTVMNNCGDPRIFENVFNLINETNDDNYMWLTVYNSATPPYIEISYEEIINISAVKFWNYNKFGELHRGVKVVDLILDEDYKNQISFVLRKGIGEENVDYSQKISFPYALNSLSEEEIEPFLNVKPASLIYSQDFETPYLPSGFNLKLSIISNWGDSKFVGFNKLNLYDQCGNEILSKNTPRIIEFPIRNKEKTSEIEIEYTTPENILGFNNPISNINNNIISSTKNIKTDFTTNLLRTSLSSSNNLAKINSKYWLTEYNDISKIDSKNQNFFNFNFGDTSNSKNLNFIGNYDSFNSNYNGNMNLNTFSNFNKNNQNIKNSEYFNASLIHEINTLYILFDKPISLSFIEFVNIHDYPDRGIKEILISLDENIIYKGNVRKFSSQTDKTTILFSSDNKIMKLINLKSLNKSNLKNGYIYKQVTKTLAVGEKEINENLNSNNSKNNTGNFSPTFNNIGSNDDSKNIEIETLQHSNYIVYQMLLEDEVCKNDNDRIDSQEK